ncbi:PaaI family thioesterase [Rubrimonas cliftonensis]|uniref:Uncharacterized domain 1-containing protein n=1 Tax=Rubrimonas cliftonensis TaxID=89524 RepID=A0A1H4ARV6_9RHOB|nr:PaaI family thioesterase [Rubrimonas cliftonensis]SEA38601.1 uncharacterized domain 1-containing protein [Rubrimonas cliftonensis]
MTDGTGLLTRMLQGLPHARALGLSVVSAGDGVAVLSAPYDPRLVGDPETGVIHGGVVTTLLDTCCGVAVLSAGNRPLSTATLDLRIDYMRPARPGIAVTARAECHRMTRSVAFVRATAWDADEDDPLASAAGAFMVELAARPAEGEGAA